MAACTGASALRSQAVADLHPGTPGVQNPFQTGTTFPNRRCLALLRSSSSREAHEFQTQGGSPPHRKGWSRTVLKLWNFLEGGRS